GRAQGEEEELQPNAAGPGETGARSRRGQDPVRGGQAGQGTPSRSAATRLVCRPTAAASASASASVPTSDSGSTAASASAPTAAIPCCSATATSTTALLQHPATLCLFPRPTTAAA